ncbi:MAG: elongation factor P [Cyanobacteriota bacterium]|nr:elongation factor P [Cyanobacteriota bacterium]
MISSNDLRPGTSIEMDGSPWRVLEFLHVKPGKGAAFVRTKLKNMQSGNVMEKTFRAGEMMPTANIEKNDMQYLFQEGDNFIFMDMASYEQAPISRAQLGDKVKYLKESMEVGILRWNETVLDVELPNTVVLEVTATDPGVKGDTATGGTKPATVETGAEIQVPLFIKIGEKIRVDTRTDTYLGRESS